MQNICLFIYGDRLCIEDNGHKLVSDNHKLKDESFTNFLVIY